MHGRVSRELTLSASSTACAIAKLTCVTKCVCDTRTRLCFRQQLLHTECHDTPPLQPLTVLSSRLTRLSSTPLGHMATRACVL
jgi:hypothetical protein